MHSIPGESSARELLGASGFILFPTTGYHLCQRPIKGMSLLVITMSLVLMLPRGALL